MDDLRVGFAKCRIDISSYLYEVPTQVHMTHCTEYEVRSRPDNAQASLVFDGDETGIGHGA